VLHFRAILISLPPNLQSISVASSNASFPFCFQTQFGEATPLLPSIWSLKFIQVIKQTFENSTLRGVQPVELSTRNLLWILLNPHLRSASPYGSLDQEDVKFLDQHSELSGLKSSSVSTLSTLDLDLVMIKVPKSKMPLEKPSTPFTQLSSFPPGLEKFGSDVFFVPQHG